MSIGKIFQFVHPLTDKTFCAKVDFLNCTSQSSLEADLV